MIQTWGIGLDEAKERGKQIYSRIGRVASPFFNNELVAFNRHGFNHVVRRGSLIRPRSQQLIRLRLLEYVEAIIKNQDGNILVEFREDCEVVRMVNRYGKKVLQKKPAKSWAFITTIDESEITMVIGQIDGGQKEFLSVMADDFELHPDDSKSKNPTK